jgi:hypothetical protein
MYKALKIKTVSKDTQAKKIKKTFLTDAGINSGVL